MVCLMRKINFIAFSAAAALALSMTTSCQKELEQAPVPSSETSTVCFTLSEPDTKTAMGEIGDKVTNVWSSDDNTRMTFYQNGKASTKVEISSSDGFKHASFTVTFPSATAGSYKYKALLAKNMEGDLPVVPAVQHPTASSFDPDANVLVGLESESYSAKKTSVNLVYKHAAAISRISFTGIPTGLTIYGVQINASSAIAGAAKSVNYSNGIVDYTDASENTISLIYDSAPSYSGGKFDAYFVTIPGSNVKITDIKLVTDKGTFVKTNSGSNTTTFDVSKFKTVKVTVPTTRTFYKASALENGINFMIVNTSSPYYAMKYSTSFDRQSVSVNGTTLTTSDPSNLLWTAEAVSGSTTNFSLMNGSVYIKKSSTLSTTTSTSSKASVSFDNSNSRLSYSNSGTYYISYNSSKSPYWQASTSKASVYLYTSKLPVSNAVSFSSDKAEYDLGTSAYTLPLPTLVGASSATYKSSNTNVATVDNSGKITIKGRGTTDITATATVNSSKIYQGGTATASYELTVTNSNIKQFKKVNTPKSGGQYFIVSGSYAMSYSSSIFSATQVTRQTTPECIEIDVTKTMPTVWTFTSSGSYWKIASGSNQLTFTYKNQTYSLTFGQSGSSWTFNSSKLSATNNNKTGYLNISSTTCSASGSSSSSTIELYEYVAGDVKKETYVKVTEAPSSWAGTYLILSSDDQKLFDYSNTTSGSSFHAASLTETITDNKIVSSDLAKYEVEIIAFDSSSDYKQPNSRSGSTYYWYEATSVTGWKVKVAGEDNTYIYSYGGGTPEKPVQTGFTQKVNNQSQTYYNAFYFDNGQIKMISTRGTDGTARYLGYHTSNGFYYVGDKSATEPTERVHLYKKQ